MTKHLSIGRWDLQISNRARHPFTHFRIHRREHYRHLIWGKLSLIIEDGTLEVHPVCAQCDSPDIREHSYGDEGWTVCNSCRSVEQGYRYISKREYENL